MQYVVKIGSLLLPRAKPGANPVRVARGHAVPEGALPASEIARLVAQGIIGPAEASGARIAGGLPPTRGKWQHDPASLAGKNADQLRAMVLDTDSSIHVDDLSEASMVQILTADFLPVFAAKVVRATDKHHPSADALAAARRGAAR